MLRAFSTAATGMTAQQTIVDVIANNLANANTVGFKRDLAVIRERLVASREAAAGAEYSHPILDGLTGGSLVSPTYTLFEQGPVEQTNNPLDLALLGEGFFAVQVGEEVRYTRDGRLTLRADGTLVTAVGGHPILDADGQPIRVDVSGPAVVIDSRGVVRQGETAVGRIGVFDFADRSVLRKVGGNLLSAGQAQPRAGNARIRSGYVERSNVEPIDELVRMIETARAYQLNGSLISLQDSMLGRAVNEIVRL